MRVKGKQQHFTLHSNSHSVERVCHALPLQRLNALPHRPVRVLTQAGLDVRVRQLIKGPRGQLLQSHSLSAL